MGLFSWIFYILMAIIMFFIIKVLDSKYSLNKMEKFIITLIFMMIVSGICYRWAINCTDDIFLFIVFLMIVDIIYNSYFTDNDFFDREEKNITYYILLVVMGFIINQEFINDVYEVFLTGEDLRIVLWFLSFIFIYKFISDKNIFDSSVYSKKKYMSSQSVLVSYAKLKNKYYDVCNYEDKELSNIVYAIMIYENNKRSSVLRNYDYFMFRLNGNKCRLGIMQVETDKFISDVQSIEMVYKKIEKLYNKKSKTGSVKKTDAYSAIDKYGRDSDYIKYIFDIIKKF